MQGDAAGRARGRGGRVGRVAAGAGALAVAADRPARERCAPATAAAVAADDAWMGVYMRGQKDRLQPHPHDPADGRLPTSRRPRSCAVGARSGADRARVAIDADDRAPTSPCATSACQARQRTRRVRRARQRRRTDAGAAHDHGRRHDRAAYSAQRAASICPARRARICAPTPLAAGRTLTVRVFDPSAHGAPAADRCDVVGREPLALDGTTRRRLEGARAFRGMETTVWLDDAGHTLREEGPLGMVVQREDAQPRARARLGRRCRSI